MHELTAEQPGSIFFREVVSRAKRAVFAVPLGYYILEAIFAPAILNLQAKTVHFTLAKEAGRTLADHKFGIAASADPNILILLKDFSQFDSSQGWENVRKYALAGFKRGLRLSGFEGPFGPYKEGLSEIIDLIWSKTKAAVFATGDNKIVTDMLNSGEFMTIIFNNVTNACNEEETVSRLMNDEQLGPLMNRMKNLHTFFMGDDSVSLWRTPYELGHKEISALAFKIEEVAKGNGLDLNAYKTSLRYFYYEYLKKTAIYGWILPRVLQIQIIGSESSNFDVPVPEQVSGYSNLVSEYVSRGGTHSICYKFLS
jgi:hypothetical protein